MNKPSALRITLPNGVTVEIENPQAAALFIHAWDEVNRPLVKASTPTAAAPESHPEPAVVRPPQPRREYPSLTRWVAAEVAAFLDGLPTGGQMLLHILAEETAKWQPSMELARRMDVPFQAIGTIVESVNRQAGRLGAEPPVMKQKKRTSKAKKTCLMLTPEFAEAYGQMPAIKKARGTG